MTDIVIASAARTPVGAFNGGLASLPAHKLGEVAIAEALRRAAGRAEGRVARSSWARSLPPVKARTRPGRPRSAPGIPFEVDRLWRQPALRLGAAHRGARLSGDPQPAIARSSSPADRRA